MKGVIHTDDGHALPVDMAVPPELVDIEERAAAWATYARSYFRGSVLAARLGDDLVFVPGDRISFITIPIEEFRRADRP